MMLAWIGYAMLAAAALGITAWLVDFAVAGRFARRRVLWAVVFFASAVGPIVFSVTRGVVAEEDVVSAPAASGRAAPIVSDRVLGSAWLAASVVFALWLVATQRRLRRRLRICSSRIVDGERVLVSSDFGPAVVGVVRPQIVLPEWTLATRESDRRIIVAHEAEHRQAHDPLLAAAALIVAVALPWNAALWWQLRRLRLAIEIDCDRRVVSRHGHDPHAYGMLLLAMRERASRVTPALAMAAMRSGLGRRVEALVDGRAQPAARRLSAGAAAVVLAAGIVAVPAPRLPMVRAAVVDASATVSPSGAAIAGGVREPIIRVIGSSIRVMLPPQALPSAQFDSSMRHRTPMERTGERREGRASSASTVDGRWVTRTAAPNRRLLQSRAAPNRWMLLPIPDSLRPSAP
jgi:beta-lactamase regulating signal transducer with metallopeptidase domain